MTNEAPDSDTLITLINKIVEMTTPDVNYMSTKLATSLNNSVNAAVSMYLSLWIAGGMNPLSAGRAAKSLVAPLAFHVGLMVGQELEATRAFEEQLGGGQ